MKKAQLFTGLSIVGMILAIVELFIFIAFYPTLAAFITQFKANLTSSVGDQSLSLFVDFFPFFILLMAMVGTMFGTRQQ